MPKRRLMQVVDLGYGIGPKTKAAMHDYKVGMTNIALKYKKKGYVRANMGSGGYHDVAAAGYNPNTTGTIVHINAIPQGAGVNDRVGKKVLMRSLQIRGEVHAPTAFSVNAMWTILIVLDKRPCGALPAITDIVDSTSSFSFNNDDNAGRFQILRRLDGIMQLQSATGSVSEPVLIHTYIPLNKGVVYKSGTTGIIAQVEEGALYAVAFGNKSAGTTACSASMGFRLRYNDN